MLDDSQVSAIIVSDPIHGVAIVLNVCVRVCECDLCAGNCAGVAGKILPVVSLFRELVEALLVFGLGVSVAIGCPAKRRLRIFHEFCNVGINSGRVCRVLIELPVLRKRFTVVRINCVIVQSVPTVTRLLVCVDGIEWTVVRRLVSTAAVDRDWWFWACLRWSGR